MYFEYLDEGRLDDRPVNTFNYGYKRSLNSKARYIAFAILSFISVSYYFWTVLPGMSRRYALPPPFLLSDHCFTQPAENPSEDVPPEPVAASVCETPECIHAASEILYNLDPDYANIDPCTNFDQYVCGGWRERHDMRPDQGSIFAGTLMAEASQTRLRHLLETEGKESLGDNNFAKLKAAYGACMDEKTISERGSKPLDDLLAKIEEVYSTDASSEGSDTNLTSAILFLMESGVEALVGPYVGVSLHEHSVGFENC